MKTDPIEEVIQKARKEHAALWWSCFEEANKRVEADWEQGGAYWENTTPATFFLRVKTMAIGLFEERMLPGEMERNA